MTSERNAKGMLAKLATMSLCMRRAAVVDRHVRNAGVCVLLCAGLIACSYRPIDKAALQEKPTVFAAFSASASESHGSPSVAASETRVAGQDVVTPPMATLRNHATLAHATRAPWHRDVQKRASSHVDEAIAEVSSSLDSSHDVDAMSTSAPRHAVVPPAADSVASHRHAAASYGGLASQFHWGWWLGVVALLAFAGLGLAVALDNRRHRRLRAAILHAHVVDPPLGEDVVPAPEQPAHEVASSQQPDWDEPPPISSPMITVVAEGRVLGEPVNADIGPIPSSRLAWRHEPGKFDAPEQWAVDAPVDFLPGSVVQALQAQALQAVESPVCESVESVASEVPVAEPDMVQTAELPEPGLAGATGDVAEQPVRTEQIDALHERDAVDDDDPLSQLFDQLEQSAMHASGDLPLLLVERDSHLPQIARTTSMALPPQILPAWESRLRQAMLDARSLALPSLLIGTLLLRADEASPQDAEALYAEAEEWVDLSMASDHEHRAEWEARRIDIDLRRAQRKKGAARLLWLRGMQTHYAPQLTQGEPPVGFAWIDVLMFWAQCQFGDAALARYAEAEAVCLRLGERPHCADAAHRRRADVLRQRATIEQGGARLHSLDTAQALTDALCEREPGADNALAAALTALARGSVLPPAQAKEAYSHALVNALVAESDPRLREQALQCRLAVQWAYENLPGMDAQSDVALKLAERLQALRVKDPDTLQRMAKTYLRSAEFARACELCEHAWRHGHATPALLSTWQEACRQWADFSNQPEQHAARQQTMRQLSIASAMR